MKSGCVCPGYPSTYECTVFGERGGTTVWQGSDVFNCTSREISLFHSDYETIEGAYGKCGEIVGQSVKTVTDDVTPSMGYVLQLTVTIRPNIIGKSIECLYDDGTTFKKMGCSMINATTGDSTINNGY